MHDSFEFKAIGHIHSPFKEKFGIPRQSGLTPSAKGKIELHTPYNHMDTVRGLERFSHIWVTFVFHQHLERDWSALVRPPRLGGNKKVGVFASRSTFRPNMIGQSVIQLESIGVENGVASLNISGLDLLDGTPVLDIKPYIPYNDALSDASSGFAPHAPDQVLKVEFSSVAAAQCHTLENRDRPHLGQLISEMVSLDPRPAYKKDESSARMYGVCLFDVNVQFSIQGDRATITDISPID